VRNSLAKWVSDADAARHLEEFGVSQHVLEQSYIRDRTDDYFIALTGELFELIREGDSNSPDWSRLGNALAQYSDRDRHAALHRQGVSIMEANLFAAAAFYFGGFPASAYVTLREQHFDPSNEIWHACYELLARPAQIDSTQVEQLLRAIRTGNLDALSALTTRTSEMEETALLLGPTEWIPAHLLKTLLTRFNTTNVRAVLPNGPTEFWSPLVASLLDRRPPVWEFFPSQIQAIEAGLLERSDSCSLQMPTGAGKTALTETLLYWHLKRDPEAAAILLVPYRSLASELRWTLIRRLNSMGVSARAAYGGTVPSGDEVQELEQTRALIATPETLSGILGADPEFLHRASLVICDEGHLLDGGSRGISLELLLARLRARDTGPPRFVFVSAIVPNIEEVNSWLAGNSESGFVVRSDYRPAMAEFAVLRPSGSGSNLTIALGMHPHETQDLQFSIDNFIARQEFQFQNPRTGRTITFPYNTVKAQALAAGRKALAIGTVAVFAANKRGNQGAVGLAEGLLEQLRYPLALPKPLDFAAGERLTRVTEYLTKEYGADWVGTKALEAGAVLHHGDIPQETREVVEGLLRNGDVRFVICTSTLAEGVNFPIRTLVLYSIQRLGKEGRPQSMLSREIKNLVGRAGRAGATTKGLVITANPAQWPRVEPVARLEPGEPVHGSLLVLINRLRAFLARDKIPLTNQFLERSPSLHTLIDGIDSTLVDLAAEEMVNQNLRA
jgi:helicase